MVENIEALAAGTGQNSASIPDSKLLHGKVARRQGGSATDWSANGTTTYDTSAVNVIMQVGVIRTSTSADLPVTFPVAFSQPPVVVFGTKLVATSSFPRISAAGVSATGFSVSLVKTDNARAADDLNWIAVGPA